MLTKICIIGPGAVGVTLAASAVENNCQVLLYGRSDGMASFLGPEIRIFRVHAPSSMPTLCDYIIVAVKYHDTLSAIEPIELGILKSDVIVVVQNGIGGLETVKGRLEGGQTSGSVIIAAGGADFGAARTGYFVRLAGTGSITVGCKGVDCRWSLGNLANCLKSGWLRVKLVEDIEPHRRLKLAVNAAINSLTAIFKGPNGVILESNELLELARGITSKAARALGVPVGEALNLLEDTLRRTAGNISSTLQDLLACRRTEIDAILGPIMDEVVEAKILYRILKALEELRLKECSGERV